MHPDAKRALEFVLAIHSGDPWHGLSNSRILEGVTAAEASSRPAEGVHTIWELVLHLTAWTREVESRLTGNNAKDPEDGDWPRVGETTEAHWRAAVKALSDAQQALAATVAGVPDDRWATRVGETRVGELGTRSTHLETLEGLIAHHAYHGGQIGLLKRWLESRKPAAPRA